MVDVENVYAVLTGDLVKSSRLTAEQSRKAMDRIRQLAQEFNDLFPDASVGQVDTFRHDSWQWLLADPSLGLRAALFIRAGLRSLSDNKTMFDTRIAIGTGPIETISKQRISDSRGLAFTFSGKTLDAMKDMRLAYADGERADAEKNSLSAGVVPLLDCIVTSWTVTESRAVYGALKGLTQEQTAENWPGAGNSEKRPTRQAVQKALQRAHWQVVEVVLEWVENRKKSNL